MKKMFFAAFVFAGMAVEAVTLPSVFSDGAVFQRGQKVPVWGKGESGEKVTVSFAGQSVSAVTGADGKWKVALAPMEASATPREMRVSGKNTITVKNIVVGEVWFCSGQSNMEFTMSRHRKVKDWEKEVANANYPMIRHFRVAHATAAEPKDDVTAKWEETTPGTIPPQSAVAYFFGETLHKELGVPVGLINSSWGGTRIEPWTPAGHKDDLWLLQNLNKWNRPQDVPTVLWNGMVAGLVPFAIKGAIWYQGCANRLDGAAYLDKTVSLVRGWRREWGQGNFPYFLVQLAPYKYDAVKGTTLAELQIAQSKVEEKVPNSGYTVINDVGDVQDIHPTDKRTVGMRMADQALDRVYGKFTRPWKTPIAKSWRAEGDKARIVFENADGLKTRDGKEPNEFELRGADGVWHEAKAVISGNDVILSAEGVSGPIGVRFAPYNGSTPNLVNGAGLPAGPFKMSRPMPFGAAQALPKADGYKLFLDYDIPVRCDFRKNPPRPQGDISAAKRVAYLLELEGKDGDTLYALAEMDVPEPARAVMAMDPMAALATGGVRTKVANLKVRTNEPRIASMKFSQEGFAEFYFSNYSPRAQPEPNGGDTRKYDFNDTPNPNPGQPFGYGCIQIHDPAAKTTILAFNHFNNADVPCDVGIGNSKGEHPDWTFSKSAADWKRRRLTVWTK
ncbi:MAG: hypothetical protein J6P13_05700 [Kiritimatiellae bacterium]|nr:hypothetical protein [Kiritimatiellia bacterium]